ncbi:MAG: hypothetical protein RI965_1574 [Bacteroidota bacterium]|jgi:hypothetical protein
MSEYRLDKNAFKAQSLKEAADHVSIYKKMTWQERLAVAAYLNSVAYNYDVSNPPKMDRTKFSVRSLLANS